MNLKLPFVGSTRIALFDEEDIGSDDRLGSITIGKNEGEHLHSQDIVGAASRYRLTYRVRDLGEDF